MADSWIDSLLPASFAGIPFFVESGSSGQCGRRVQLTNFPFSDRFSVDDLGQLNAPSVLRGFILDDDGDLQSRHEQLVDALNQGQNTLVHPRHGSMQVLPGQCSYTFQGSRIRYQLQFLPIPDTAGESEQEETAALVNAQCDAAADATSAENIEVPNRSVLDSAQAHLDGVLSSLRGANGQINAAISPVAELTQAIDEISDLAVDLIRTPATLFNSVRGVYYGVLNASTSISDAMNAYRGLKFSPDVENKSATPSQVARANNQQAMSTAFESALLIEMIRIVSERSADLDVASNEDSPFDSYQQAIAIRDALLEDLDSVIESLNSQAFNSMVELRARFYRHIDAHGIRLPRITEVKYGVALPVWVIAHDIYGDVSLMSDIVRRNAIAQPVRVEENTALEVLRYE